MSDLTIRVPEIRVPPDTRATFRPGRHPDVDRLAPLMAHARDMQALADEYGIPDIFQDGGGKLLQILIRLSAQNVPGRPFFGD